MPAERDFYVFPTFKRGIKPRVVALGDAATITSLNCEEGEFFDLATLSQNSTIPAPSGTPYEAQTLVIRIVSSASRTLNWNAIFIGASNLSLPTATTGGGVMDAIGFRYSSLLGKWVLFAFTIGAVSVVTTSVTVEVNFVSPSTGKFFVITVPSAVIGQKVIACPSLVMPAGVAEDELEADPLICYARVSATNQVRLFVGAANGASIIGGKRNINLLIGG